MSFKEEDLSGVSEGDANNVVEDIIHKEILNEKLKRKYEFTISHGYIDDKIKSRLRKIQETFFTAGFRKGKVPLYIVEERKRDEVVNNVIGEQVNLISNDFLRKKRLNLIGKPIFDKINFDHDLKYNIAFEVFPNIPKFDTAELNLKKNIVAVSEENIEKKLKEMCEECFELIVAPEDHKIRDGDVVYIDFEGKINDLSFEGGTANDFMVIIGSNSILHEIENALLGLAVGEEIEVEAEFPEDYPMRDLASKKAIFSVRIKKIMIKKFADDEDKIIKHFKCQSKEELRKKAKDLLQDRVDFMVYMIAKKNLFDYLDKEYIFDVPESVVKVEENRIISQYKDKEERLKKAERRVRIGFLLMEIAKEKKISVTEEDISKSLFAKSQGSKDNMRYIIDVYKKNPQAALSLKGEVLEEKVTQFLVKNLREDKAISFAELEEKFSKIKE